MIEEVKILINKYLHVLIVIVLALEFFATVYLHVFHIDSTRLIGVYKLVLEVILLFLIIKSKISLKVLRLITVLAVFLLVNQFFFNPNFLSDLTNQFLYKSLYYLNRYLYIFVVIFSYDSWCNQLKTIHLVVIWVERLLLFNAVLILIGICFQINIFRSYPWGIRFGYNGLFNKINETSSLYMIFLINLYYQIINYKNKNKIIFFWLIVIISLLTGAKIMILFLLMLFVFHLLFMSRHKSILRKVIPVFIITGAIFLNKIATYLFSMSPFWESLSKKYSVFTMLMSTRDIVVLNNIKYIQSEWNWVNFFIGGPFYNDNFQLTEMDIIGPILFFGVVGSIIYFYLIYRHFYKKQFWLRNALVMIVFLCGFVAGSVFISVSAMLYLYLSNQLIYKRN